MGSIKNTNENIFTISPNILLSIDDNDMGDMYVYDNDRGYILNGTTASDLVDFFAYNDNMHISNEIIDVLLDMTINKGTH